MLTNIRWIVGYRNDCSVVPLPLPDHISQIVACFRVNGIKRLIEQNEWLILQYDSCKECPLQLATRQRPDHPVFKALQPDSG